MNPAWLDWCEHNLSPSPIVQHLQLTTHKWSHHNACCAVSLRYCSSALYCVWNYGQPSRWVSLHLARGSFWLGMFFWVNDYGVFQDHPRRRWIYWILIAPALLKHLLNWFFDSSLGVSWSRGSFQLPEGNIPTIDVVTNLVLRRVFCVSCPYRLGFYSTLVSTSRSEFVCSSVASTHLVESIACSKKRLRATDVKRLELE